MPHSVHTYHHSLQVLNFIAGDSITNNYGKNVSHRTVCLRYQVHIWLLRSIESPLLCLMYFLIGEACCPPPPQASAGVHQSQEWGEPGGQAYADFPVASQPSPGL